MGVSDVGVDTAFKYLLSRIDPGSDAPTLVGRVVRVTCENKDGVTTIQATILWEQLEMHPAGESKEPGLAVGVSHPAVVLLRCRGTEWYAILSTGGFRQEELPSIITFIT